MASHFEFTAGSFIGPTESGFVLQSVNKLTDVTLNKEYGSITMNYNNGTSDGIFRFTVFNDRVSGTDLVLANINYALPDTTTLKNWALQITNVQEGKFDVYLKQLVSGSFVIFVHFCILKGAAG